MQTTAEGEAKAADIAAKHLRKLLAEQQQALSAKQQEAGTLDQDLKREQAAVSGCESRLAALPYDPAAATQLEATVASQQAAVRAATEKVDTLSSQLGGAALHSWTPVHLIFTSSGEKYGRAQL